MHGLLRCNINAGVHTCVHGADMSLRDVTIAQMGNGARECKWCHALEARGGFWEFWRKSVELRTRPWTGRVDFHLLAEALGGCAWDGGGADGKARIERMCISLLISKNLLNSKVIKSFIPELRSRKCFSCFEIPMFYIYICYEHSMYVSHIRIRLWYTHKMQ